MKLTVKIEKQVEITLLKVRAKVRYWEDSSVNGVDDVEGDLIPCRNGDIWQPEINVETGQISNWEIGKSAEIHYKVCDAGSYELISEDGDVVAFIHNDYVPNMLCPKDNGYGDYIIMDVDKSGFIQDWKADFNEFENDSQ